MYLEVSEPYNISHNTLFFENLFLLNSLIKEPNSVNDCWIFEFFRKQTENPSLSSVKSIKDSNIIQGTLKLNPVVEGGKIGPIKVFLKLLFKNLEGRQR